MRKRRSGIVALVMEIKADQSRVAIVKADNDADALERRWREHGDKKDREVGELIELINELVRGTGLIDHIHAYEIIAGNGGAPPLVPESKCVSLAMEEDKPKNILGMTARCVKLCVGGRIFATSLATLTSVKNTFLESMFGGKQHVISDKSLHAYIPVSCVLLSVCV